MFPAKGFAIGGAIDRVSQLIGDPLAGSAAGLTRLYLFFTFEEGLGNLGF